MDDQQLREIERLAVDQDRLFDPSTVIGLIAEVRRLNRLGDRDCETVIGNNTMPHPALLRKCLEEAADNG